MGRRRQLESTAYHEAGHAVMRFLLGMSVHEVSVVPNEETLGHCTGSSLRAPLDLLVWGDGHRRRKVERYILVSLAGGAAEAAFQGRYNWRGMELDLDCAIDLALKVCGGEAEAGKFAEWLLERARNLIIQDHTWAAVRRIAAALLKERRLSGRRAKAIYDGAAAHVRAGARRPVPADRPNGRGGRAAARRRLPPVRLGRKRRKS
jgi:hypothetical protein